MTKNYSTILPVYYTSLIVLIFACILIVTSISMFIIQLLNARHQQQQNNCSFALWIIFQVLTVIFEIFSAFFISKNLHVLDFWKLHISIILIILWIIVDISLLTLGFKFFYDSEQVNYAIDNQLTIPNISSLLPTLQFSYKNQNDETMSN